MEQWQTKCDTILKRDSHLLETKLFWDCVFRVGSDEFRVHKQTLAKTSPVFEAMLYGDLANTEQPIQIDDEEPQTFQSLLEYIYTGEVNIESVEAAWKIYHVADKYILPFLMKECLEYIYNNISPTDVCETYRFAKLYNKTNILNKYLKIIERHIEWILSNDSFLELDISALVDIFDLPGLNISCETKLFKAAERYYQNQTENEMQSDSFDSTSENSESDNSPELTIRNILEKIRFLSLSPKVFTAEIGESNTLLTQSEGYAILQNISYPKCKTPLPQGFSTCRKRRSRIPEENKHIYIKLQNEAEKLNAVYKLGKSYHCVILCNTKEDIFKIRNKLESNKRKVFSIHEDMSETDRDDILQNCYNKQSNNLVASASLIKDIEVLNVYAIVNYILPSKTDYAYTIPGKPIGVYQPVTINLITNEQVQNILDIEAYYSIKMKETPMSSTFDEIYEY